MYLLHERCGVQYEQARRMPVAVRRWWLARKMRDEAERERLQGGRRDDSGPVPQALRGPPPAGR